MLIISFLLVSIAALGALSNWRLGLSLCVLIAVLQDPLRKMVAGEPGYFTLLVGVVFAAAITAALIVKITLLPTSIHGWKKAVGKPFSFFFIIVILQALHSFISFGSPMITGIGLIAYLAPIPAIVFAYQFSLREQLPGIQRWMWFYVIAAGIGLSGIYLEYIGFTWTALGEVGEGLTIYDLGTVLKAYSGFFRSSEVAAWHTATISCFLFMLLVGKKPSIPNIVLALTLVAILITLGLMTGRRKMFVMVVSFISTYLFLIAWLQFHATRLALIVALAGLLSFFILLSILPPDPVDYANKSLTTLNTQQDYYQARGMTVFEDIPARVNELGIQPAISAVSDFGLFGLGLGTGSQGIQHVAGSESIQRGAAEGGLGKITMELGVPGLFIIIWLIFSLAKYIKNVIYLTTKHSPTHARMAYGWLAFIVANTASFSVATQVFGDLFVQLMMGWAVGFLLAMPILSAKPVSQKQVLIAPPQTKSIYHLKQ